MKTRIALGIPALLTLWSASAIADASKSPTDILRDKILAQTMADITKAREKSLKGLADSPSWGDTFRRLPKIDLSKASHSPVNMNGGLNIGDIVPGSSLESGAFRMPKPLQQKGKSEKIDLSGGYSRSTHKFIRSGPNGRDLVIVKIK